MAAKEITVLSYLMRKNPVVDASQGCKGQNTTSNRQIWKEPFRISQWKDFQPESLKSIYDGSLKRILDMSVQFPDSFHIPPFPFCEIHDEDSLESLLILWTQQIVSNALAVTQDNLNSLCTSGRIYMVRGGQARRLESYPKKEKRRNSFPDWAAVKKLATTVDVQDKACNLLPGDTKISSKWKSHGIKFGDRNAYKSTPNSARPIIQVFNYCLKANVRYGYIITDQELVVLRIRASDAGTKQAKSKGIEESQEAYASEGQKKARRSGEVELVSVPWDNHATDPRGDDCKLSINLALWWLHILAATECGIESSYPELSGEKLPPKGAATNVSFSTEVAKMNLATSASFSSEDGSSFRSGRKRKLDAPTELPGESNRRKERKSDRKISFLA